MFSHRFHRFTQIVRVRSVSHRIHRIHRCMVQKKSHRFHRARRSLSLKHLCKSVKSVGVYLIRSFCEFGVFRGSTSHQKLLCNSVKSVGVHFSRRFCEFGVFRGSTSHQKILWIRRIPWEYISSEASVNSAYSVGVHRSSRLRGVGRDAVPSYARSL